MRLQRPTAGQVLFDGADIWAASGEALARLRRRFQVVFQDPQSSLDPRMPVAGVIAEPLAVADRLSAAERQARVVRACRAGRPPARAAVPLSP